MTIRISFIRVAGKILTIIVISIVPIKTGIVKNTINIKMEIIYAFNLASNIEANPNTTGRINPKGIQLELIKDLNILEKKIDSNPIGNDKIMLRSSAV